MEGYHFLSYSRVDARDFAIQLSDAILIGEPSISTWVDHQKLKPGDDWDEQIVEAIRSCESLIFLMTKDSTKSQSVCKLEWTRALKYKKPLIPIRLHPDAEMPFRLGSRQYIDFTVPFDTALARLRSHLQWLASPEGKKHALKDRLADAQRDVERASSPIQATRAKEEVEALEAEILKQEEVITNPKATAQRVEESIQRGIERERQPAKPTGGITSTKFINPPPGIVPSYFQDRHAETKLIGDFLRDESKSLLTLTGRGGIGKTAMVCRLLKFLEGGQLPDNLGPLSLDGIVYLSTTGSRKVTFPNIFSDASQLLHQDIRKELESLYKSPQVSTETKMKTLLTKFPAGRVVLLLDNFEDLLEPDSRDIIDTDLNESLGTLLLAPTHAFKVIITTRVRPYSLLLVQPGRQSLIDLDEGLPSPYAENILRELDSSGRIGLKNAPDILLEQARVRTRGYPRALEALYAILAADRDTSLTELLSDTEQLLPENVIEVLVGEAFCRLDSETQQVIQALAIYGHPVPTTALDFLLKPFLLGIDCAPILNRLVNMQFVRKEAGRYYLHPVDRNYALNRLTAGSKQDRDEEENDLPFTQFALRNRAANYFEAVRLPRENWRTVADLEPQLAEFELRCEGEDYETAALVLLLIDHDYLYSWSHFRLLVELHERLQGHLTDQCLNRGCLVGLGNAYGRLGQLQLAKICFEQALESAKEDKDKENEGIALGCLSNCYGDLGDANRKIEALEQALDIARSVDDRKNEGIWLMNLGIGYQAIGENSRSVDYYLQALLVSQEVGDQTGEALTLLNLGLSHHELGELTPAQDCFEKALSKAIKIGDSVIKSASLSGLGFLDLFREQPQQAISRFREALQIADQISFVQYQNSLRESLGKAFLSEGNLFDARQMAEEALQYKVPLSNHSNFSLLGIIALRQADEPRARIAFLKSIECAEELLQQNKKNFRAMDSKAISQCGLSLCQKDQSLVPSAKEGFTGARAINKDPGYVWELLLKIDALAQADSQGVLTSVRDIAAGSS